DFHVTGVQTCALPIFTAALATLRERALVWGDTAVRVAAEAAGSLPWYPGQATVEDTGHTAEDITARLAELDTAQSELLARLLERSEERRVGKEREAGG